MHSRVHILTYLHNPTLMYTFMMLRFQSFCSGLTQILVRDDKLAIDVSEKRCKYDMKLPDDAASDYTANSIRSGLITIPLLLFAKDLCTIFNAKLMKGLCCTMSQRVFTTELEGKIK